MRWIELMENYDFVVEHCADKSHGNADSMSRIQHNERSGIGSDSTILDEEMDELNDVRVIRIDNEIPNIVGSETNIETLMASVADEQWRDGEICVLADTLLNNYIRPVWNEVASWSAICKALCSCSFRWCTTIQKLRKHRQSCIGP